ncbi:nuclear transport factor 2 family protein [Variovorax sp. J31P207]|uniref:nuclear transport factor 2 family protein n=1 Tax=Variovorax sp. J31P207 TaxID=3053510 RepID=UPI002577497B|nr:nuclear transport factor 2 family protein [Variovorax sp. J31P207]MDM0071535.1 nuclear transport factor 2 family protein [Variovorax sp. J31P207]
MAEKTPAPIAEPMQEIIDLLNQYAWSFDSNDMARLGRLFCEGAVTEGRVDGTDVRWGPWQGPEEIAAELGEARRLHSHWRRHQMTTPLFVDLQADRATVKTYLSLFSCEGGQTPVIEVTGEYQAEVSKVADAWKISALRVVLDSAF